MTKLLAIGMVAAAAQATKRARHRIAEKRQQEMNELDFADLDEPVVVSEQEIEVTDAELVPEPQPPPMPPPEDTAWEMPGRGAGPR